MSPGPISLTEQQQFAAPIERKKAIVPCQMPKEAGISMGQLGQQNIFVVDQVGVDQGNMHLARQIATERSKQGENEAFLVFNVDTVVRLVEQWRMNMPRVKPFYAVKCNNDPVLVAALARLGTGFDCASREEIDLILDNGFAQASDIIYANTCKTPEYIRHAESRGIHRFTFDCVEELVKVKKEHKNAQMVLRIDVTDSSAKRPLDIKFGCHPTMDAPRLLAIGKQMEMDIIGISFHVGSGCQNPLVYREAIGMARRLFNIGKEMGHQMQVLDLGGGFPGCENERDFFEELSKVVCDALEEYFPAKDALLSSPQRKISTDSGLGFEEEEDEGGQFEEGAGNRQLEIIAEPGRYFASSPSAICANVIGATRVNAQKLTKKSEDEAKEAYMYYLDDGVYGSFSCLSSRLFTKIPDGKPLFSQLDQAKFLSVIWGPTCDSRDQVEQLCLKPRLEPGDWLFYSEMGAYTRVTATEFNGFTRPKDAYYIVGKQTWDILRKMGEKKGEERQTG